jgi:hypothetical protein
LSPSSQKYEFGIRDLEKTLSGSQIQGSKRHRIPDPDSQHCIYILSLCVELNIFFLVDLNQRLEDPEAKADFEKGMVVPWNVNV